ncbi:hypothetical protein ACNQ1M_02730 [Mycoplasma sp. VS424B]|uniref:hypothetical protein n=1 Tax=unclassified Mycoplasma TaxID=2683645 RepID=UPI003AABED4B
MKNNKIKVFIDFEAITNNFLKRLPGNLNVQFLPYCYTIGMYRENDLNKGFMTKTSMMSFKNFNYRTYLNKLKSNLLNDLSILAKEEISAANLAEKVEFYGWNPQMENIILNKLFGINCFNASKYNGKRLLSLKIVVPHLHRDDYFIATRALFEAKQPEVDTSIFDDPGFAASFLGFIRFQLFNKAKKPTNKLNLTLQDLQIIDTDIVNYNKDDVLKLDYCYRNQDIILQRSNHLNTIDSNINKTTSALSHQKKLLKNFTKYAKKYEETQADDSLLALEKYANDKIHECNLLLKFIKNLPENVASLEDAIMWAELKIEATNDKIEHFKKERKEF